MKKIVIAFLALIFCFAAVNYAQASANQNLFHFNGVFKDETSAVIAGLSLTFDNEGQKINSYTDENGEFQAMLPAGDYQLTISKSISEDFIAHIKIQENGLNPNDLEFIVKPSSKCCQTESGVPFPKAVSVLKPPYPPAARAVNAFGDVIVNVKIDESGKVISAQAVSGHPLLRQACVAVSKQSLFESAENSSEREVNLTFVFLLPANKTKVTKHYSNPYRIEIIGQPLTVDY